jgi:hypothetical protein
MEARRSAPCETLGYPPSSETSGCDVKFTLFSPTGLDALVQDVARRITARYPPLVANNPERTVSQNRVEEILEDTFDGALRFQRDTPTGFLARARLRSTFRRELREIGYEDKFVDFAAGKFIEQLTRGMR